MRSSRAFVPGMIVVIANLALAAAWASGGTVGLLYAVPVSLIGLVALGFGLRKGREPLLLLGLPLLVLPLGMWAILFSRCAEGICR